MRVRRLLAVLAAVILAGCAIRPPFSDETLKGVDRGFTVQDALQHPDHLAKVMWGGVVVGAANFSDHTDFSILSYPLNRQEQPDLDQVPGPRFIARYPGYVETMVYQPNRIVTVTGTFQGLEQGKIGQAPYQFPVVKTTNIFAWPVDDDDRSSVHFGFGLGLGMHM